MIQILLIRILRGNICRFRVTAIIISLILYFVCPFVNMLVVLRAGVLQIFSSFGRHGAAPTQDYTHILKSVLWIIEWIKLYFFSYNFRKNNLFVLVVLLSVSLLYFFQLLIVPVLCIESILEVRKFKHSKRTTSIITLSVLLSVCLMDFCQLMIIPVLCIESILEMRKFKT